MTPRPDAAFDCQQGEICSWLQFCVLFVPVSGRSPPVSATAPVSALSSGVFTPTILTILGVIMYLRFGWVVGQVGLWLSLLIVLMANGITLITAFSFSASIATNTRVGVGGAYFMISRSLGPEIGGAIGNSAVFFPGAVGYPSMPSVWPSRCVLSGRRSPSRGAAFCIILLVGFLAYRGAGAALKLQLPILLLIILSLLALAGGVLFGNGSEQVAEPATFVDVGFWAVFAVFFPGSDRDHGGG